jgi:hypothetical protein
VGRASKANGCEIAVQPESTVCEARNADGGAAVSGADVLALRSLREGWPAQTERLPGRRYWHRHAVLLPVQHALAFARPTINPVRQHVPNEVRHRPPIKLRRRLKPITQLALNPKRNLAGLLLCHAAASRV